jgi:hypothetical protein
MILKVIFFFLEKPSPLKGLFNEKKYGSKASPIDKITLMRLKRCL